MLAAIQTRHHSGYQREAWARELASFPAPWAAPYAALLLEDYVYQTAMSIEEYLKDDWIRLLQQFAVENSEWSRPCNYRIVCHWEPYRHLYPRITEYPAYRVMEKLGLWDRKTCPKLLARYRRLDNKR